MIIALDISTSIVGAAVIDAAEHVIKYQSIDLRKIKNFVEKVEKAKNICLNLVKDLDIHTIIIEENLQSFRTGFSSASTINKLARFNGALSYALGASLNCPVISVNVIKARKKIGIKLQKERDCGISTKEQVRSYLDLYLLERSCKINWETKKLTRGPRKGTTVWADGVYDISDACVVGLAWLKK